MLQWYVLRPIVARQRSSGRISMAVSSRVLTVSLTLNVLMSFNRDIDIPVIGASACVHPMATVNGSVTLSEQFFVAPGASIRGDEKQNIFIGQQSNVQDGVVQVNVQLAVAGQPQPISR